MRRHFEFITKTDIQFIFLFALVMGIKATGCPVHAMPEQSEPVGLGFAGYWAGARIAEIRAKMNLILNLFFKVI